VCVWVEGGGSRFADLTESVNHHRVLLQRNHHTGSALCRPASKYVVGRRGWGGSRGVGGGGGRCVLSLNSGGGAITQPGHGLALWLVTHLTGHHGGDVYLLDAAHQCNTLSTHLAHCVWWP
jgi:hypothetical protein